MLLHRDPGKKQQPLGPTQGSAGDGPVGPGCAEGAPVRTAIARHRGTARFCIDRNLLGLDYSCPRPGPADTLGADGGTVRPHAQPLVSQVAAQVGRPPDSAVAVEPN